MWVGRKCQNEKNEKMRKLGNEKMGCEVVLEEWGCASEIKQNLNKIKATPCKPAEGLLVYSTLPKFETWAKFEMKKRRVETVRSIRKETEKFGRGEVEFLVKKGCKMGEVSL